MAPKVFRCEVSKQCDQHSLAATWNEMRDGLTLICGKKLLELSKQNQIHDPDLSSVPPGEQNVLLNALAKKPDKRYPTCAAFVEALTPPEKVPPAPPGVISRNLGEKIAIAVLAVALTALLMMLWAVLTPTPPPTDRPKAHWLPFGWEPMDDNPDIKDLRCNHYHWQLTRSFAGELVAVPQKSSNDWPTFYIRVVA